MQSSVLFSLALSDFPHLLGVWLFCLGLWMVIFGSPLQITLLEKWTGSPCTSDDVDLWLAQRSHWFLLKLRTCLWCQAFWTSLTAVLLQCFLLRPLSLLWVDSVLILYPFTFTALCLLRRLSH